MYILYICVNTSDQSWIIMWNKMRSRLAYVCSYYLRMCLVFTPCLLFTVGPHGTPHGMAFGLPDKKHDARLPDKNCRVCVLMFTGSAVLFMCLYRTFWNISSISRFWGVVCSSRSDTRGSLYVSGLEFARQLMPEWHTNGKPLPPIAISLF